MFSRTSTSAKVMVVTRSLTHLLPRGDSALFGGQNEVEKEVKMEVQAKETNGDHVSRVISIIGQRWLTQGRVNRKVCVYR